MRHGAENRHLCLNGDAKTAQRSDWCENSCRCNSFRMLCNACVRVRSRSAEALTTWGGACGEWWVGSGRRERSAGAGRGGGYAEFSYRRCWIANLIQMECRDVFRQRRLEFVPQFRRLGRLCTCLSFRVVSSEIPGLNHLDSLAFLVLEFKLEVPGRVYPY